MNFDEETVKGPLLLLKVERTKKNRGDGTKYFFSESFASLELAKKAINEEDSWAYKCKKDENCTDKNILPLQKGFST